MAAMKINDTAVSATFRFTTPEEKILLGLVKVFTVLFINGSPLSKLNILSIKPWGNTLEKRFSILACIMHSTINMPNVPILPSFLFLMATLPNARDKYTVSKNEIYTITNINMEYTINCRVTALKI